ncbi:MAG: ORF6N domain-containing protein [Bdellovibrio sp.]|nr:ORF6N domain-containing protein [Bdellovibrio sp.]
MNTKQPNTVEVESKIYLIRNLKVMLDFDLSELYQVPTMRLNQQVRRNIYRFPEDFMFTLTNQEVMHLKSQIVISSSRWGGRRKPPLAFTEQGIAMLSSVLNSRRAIEVNIAIMRTFVKLKTVLISNKELGKKITELESKYDGQFQLVFEAIREIVSHHAVPRKRIIGLEPPLHS